MDTVKNPYLDVFNRWEQIIVPIVGESNYSMEPTQTISNEKKQYARLYMLGNPGHDYDLEGNECATIASFQSDSFSNVVTGAAIAYEIDDATHKCMTQMGFRRTYGPRLIENAETTMKRVVSRYSRVFSGSLT